MAYSEEVKEKARELLSEAEATQESVSRDLMIQFELPRGPDPKTRG